MGKFKVLGNHEIILIKLGFYSHRYLAQPLISLFTSFTSYYILVVTSTCTVGSTKFAQQNWSQTDVVLRTCTSIIGSYEVLGIFVSLRLKINQMNLVHFKLQEIVNNIIKGIFFITNEIAFIQIDKKKPNELHFY